MVVVLMLHRVLLLLPGPMKKVTGVRQETSKHVPMIHRGA